MRNEEIKSELAALRAEVVALAAAREEAAPPQEDPGSIESSDEEADISEVEDEGVMGQIQELIELLEHELKETPVVSGLAIFAVGILVGRFLR